MKSRKNSLSRKTKFNALELASRRSAYAFVACLGVWLPKSYAATLVNLDATALPEGELTTWSNTGTLGGDFTVGLGATANPTNVVVDGVRGVAFENGAGGTGSHMVGPVAPTAVAANNPRTVEAWVLDMTPGGAQTAISWGRRGADGLNNAFGLGTNNAWGAVGMWGAPDIGWNDMEVFGRWTYIVQSFDGTTNSVYVDGVLANSEGPPATGLINTAEVDTSLNPIPFRLARETDAGGAVSDASQFNGVIARVRVHDVALDATAIANQFEAERGDFGLVDTDGDGMPDWWENRFGLNPDVDDSGDDADSDGLTNGEEFATLRTVGTLLVSTDPTNPDSDADGSTDGNEVHVAGTDPLNPDTDNDGLLDGVETNTGTFVDENDTGTNPLNGDTDGDLVSDGMEIALGTDPNDPNDTPDIPAAIALDATSLPTGPLTNWTNTGFIAGDFSVPTNATVPSVTSRDGVNGVALTTGGTTGTHYVGPAQIEAVSFANPRTVTAWVWDDSPQGEQPIIAWGARNNGNGANFSFGLGQNNTWGAVAMWGAPDIGYADQEVYGRWTHVAATFDGTDTFTYVEGELADSQTETVSTTLFQTNDGITPLRFRIGRQNTPTGGIDNTGSGAITIGAVTVYTNFLDGATIKARFEAERGTFNLNDTDGDGLPDWWEVRHGLDKNDATGNNGADGDPDGDTLTNEQELALGTNPTNPDTDDDGLRDDFETDTGVWVSSTDTGTSPVNPDTDGDGLRDGVETNTGVFVDANDTGTNPLVADTDGDGFSDGLEVSQGSDPTDPLSIPDPSPILSLASSDLPPGALNIWPSTGIAGGDFVADPEDGGGVVETVLGVNAVTLSGGIYTGPVTPNFVTGNPSYSVEAWVLNPTAAGEESVLAWGRRGEAGLNTSLNHGTSAAFGAMTHWAGQDLGYGSPDDVVEGRWTHIVYTYDAISGVQTIYADGQFSNDETIAPLNIASVDTGGNPLPFRLGAQNNGDGTPTGGLRFTGSIAQVNVFTRAIPASEVTERFNAGAIEFGTGDQDGDGMPDWFERTFDFLDENDPSDANEDFDNDGLTNVQEFNPNFPSAESPFRSDPSNPDTDGDGLLDGEEVLTHFTNPSNTDTDQDGLPDNIEIALGTTATGDFTAARDSDGDGFSDAKEVVYGSDPLDPASVPDTSNPIPFVNLDFTGLPLGPVASLTNNNALGWTFNAPTGAVASVDLVDGTKGLVFNGTNQYRGPNTPLEMTGNASRTVEAWIWNPSVGAEETIFAWGARGADGRNSAFSHGRDAGFGALQFWGPAADVPWGPDAASIVANTPASAWTHVAYTYDNMTGVRACYVDGVLAHSETDINLVLDTFALDASDELNTLTPPIGRTLPIRLGAQNEQNATASGAAPSTMTIAKVRAYDVALSAAQIAANHNAERVEFPGQPVLTDVRVDPVTGFVTFDWTPAEGQTYGVQRNTTDVGNPADWSTIATGETSGTFTDDPEGADSAYYRMFIE